MKNHLGAGDFLLKHSPLRTMNTTKRILKEYEGKKELYEKFAAAVASLLESMLKKGYKYHLDVRIKDADSLAKKIERKRAKGKIYAKLEDIQDIAGIRIIFYTENDRRKFLQKLEKEFGAAIETKTAAKVSGYRAVHAILSLGEERLKLPEYEAYKGLVCEVQLSLILEHAWAEIEHDILYKENFGFRKLSLVEYVQMKERMGAIMKNHIQKASDELERVVMKYKRFKRRTRAK